MSNFTKRDADLLSRLAGPRPSNAGYLAAVAKAVAPHDVYLLALDPSSTCTGWATFGSTGSLIDCGKFKPPKKQLANDRIARISAAITDLIRVRRPAFIIIEDTSGKVGKRHKGNGAGLAVHGKAIGFIACTITLVAPYAQLQCIAENEWTRGLSKEVRKFNITHTHHGLYDPACDSGGDVSDAIGLGDWWFVQRRFAVAPAASGGTRE